MACKKYNKNYHYTALESLLYQKKVLNESRAINPEREKSIITTFEPSFNLGKGKFIKVEKKACDVQQRVCEKNKKVLSIKSFFYHMIVLIVYFWATINISTKVKNEAKQYKMSFWIRKFEFLLDVLKFVEMKLKIFRKC